MQFSGERAFAGRWLRAGHWLRLLRLPHWVKNAVVFPGVVLAGRAGDAAAWQQALWVFAAFCLASSAVYAVNDVLDREVDRLHPVRCRRPVAAGLLAPRPVLAVGLVLALGGLAVSYGAAPPAAACVGLYLLLNLAYSLRLKHIPVVDASSVAFGFVLRLVSVLGVPGDSVRGWLLTASVFMLCFFVAISKRAADLDVVGAGGLGNGALRVADGYTYRRLRGLLATSGVVTILCYLTFAREVGGTAALVAQLSALPVAYCLCRLARLSLVGQRAQQIDLVRRDARLLAAVALWAGLWLWAMFV